MLIWVIYQQVPPRQPERRLISIYRIIKAVGSLVPRLEGLAAIIFTGSMGENKLEIRKRIIKKLAWLGIEPDEPKNRANVTLSMDCMDIPRIVR